MRFVWYRQQRKYPPFTISIGCKSLLLWSSHFCQSSANLKFKKNCYCVLFKYKSLLKFKNWLFAMMGIYKTCTCKYMEVCMVQGCRALQRQWPITHVQRLDGNGPEVSETTSSSSWHSPCWRYNVPSVVTRHLPGRGRRI